ncbi:MAG: nucleoside hydrolase [Ruminococcaceae bacterium]|nr:nucleoside hydrolase [Oscillospiraceae bacterium]
MSQKRSLALLCDYGLDDMVATLYLLDHAALFNTIDILPIAGNFTEETSARNARRILTHCPNRPENVRLVDTAAVPQHGEPIPNIHGNDGIGDFLPLVPDTVPEGVPFLSYSEWLKDVDEHYTIVSLGPCTVTQDILKKKGALPLVMMAGNVAEPPNFNGREFNHALDVDAFAACVAFPHVTATLDSCHHPLTDFYHITPDGNDLLCRAVAAAVSLARHRGESTCRIYDLLTAVYLVHPDRFAVREDIDPDGNRLSYLAYLDSRPLIGR